MEPLVTTPDKGSEALNPINGTDNDGRMKPPEALDGTMEGAVVAPATLEHYRTHERRRERDAPMTELILPKGSKR